MPVLLLQRASGVEGFSFCHMWLFLLYIGSVKLLRATSIKLPVCDHTIRLMAMDIPAMTVALFCGRASAECSVTPSVLTSFRVSSPSLHSNLHGPC